MDLDRNINPTGKGKYALLNLRKLPGELCTPQDLAAAILTHPEAIEWGCVGAADEFFVIKLKDEAAEAALDAYAGAASDPQFGAQVFALARRAGPNHPLCRVAD